VSRKGGGGHEDKNGGKKKDLVFEGPVRSGFFFFPFLDGTGTETGSLTFKK
jgi:hypothetical protein